MPSSVLTSTPHRRAQHSVRWLEWQASTVSQRLLSQHAREKGYTVVQVPPPLRDTFLDVVEVLRLYDLHFHKPQRTLSPDQLACLRVWAESMQALIGVLQEHDHD